MESYRRRRAARGLPVRERRTGPPGTAWCPDCEAFRDVADFPRNRSTSSGYAAYCKPHQYERTRQSRDRAGGSRGYHLKRRYGLTAEDVESMRAEQRGLCAICRRVLGPGAHVDHDHRTGAVRGLLCFTCNVGLGNFKDDPGRLEQAARYLREVRLPELVFEVSPEAWQRPFCQVGSRP
ncbi:endonuclease VII domain-containing protein [Angustibacter peucedani]